MIVLLHCGCTIRIYGITSVHVYIVIVHVLLHYGIKNALLEYIWYYECNISITVYVVNMYMY